MGESNESNNNGEYNNSEYYLEGEAKVAAQKRRENRDKRLAERLAKTLAKDPEMLAKEEYARSQHGEQQIPLNYNLAQALSPSNMAERNAAAKAHAKAQAQEARLMREKARLVRRVRDKFTTTLNDLNEGNEYVVAEPNDGAASSAASSAAPPRESSIRRIHPYLFDNETSVASSSAARPVNVVSLATNRSATTANNLASSSAAAASNLPVIELLPTGYTRDTYVKYAAKVLTLLILKTCEEFYQHFSEPATGFLGFAKSVGSLTGLAGKNSHRTKFIIKILKSIYAACYDIFRVAEIKEASKQEADALSARREAKRTVPSVVNNQNICNYIRHIINPSMLQLIKNMADNAPEPTATAFPQYVADHVGGVEHGIIPMFMGPPTSSSEVAFVTLNIFDENGDLIREMLVNAPPIPEKKTTYLEAFYGANRDVLDALVARGFPPGSKNKHIVMQVHGYMHSPYYEQLTNLTNGDNPSGFDILNRVQAVLAKEPRYNTLLSGGAKHKKRRTIKKRRTHRKKHTIRRHK
jgi:hypothetical protein